MQLPAHRSGIFHNDGAPMQVRLFGADDARGDMGPFSKKNPATR